ncbi:MAG: hypothetical protein ACOX1N_05035 [Candidatus Methanomethylophilaceae archaeon]|jgi:hypothetical protein
MSCASKADKKTAAKTEVELESDVVEETVKDNRVLMTNKVYTRQMPDVLPENYNEAEDERSLHGNRKCYDCCTDEHGCCSPGCTICLVGVAAVCCLLCCYTTDGFNGIWTYWPN